MKLLTHGKLHMSTGYCHGWKTGGNLGVVNVACHQQRQRKIMRGKTEHRTLTAFFSPDGISPVQDEITWTR